jgi:hypothetical protein
MSVDVAEQVRRLVESFDEFVDDLSTDEVLQRVGGVSESGEPAPSTPPTTSRRSNRSSWRRFSVAAAAVILVGGLVGALVWVNADRSTPSSDAPPPATQATTPAASLGEFVWPAPPRGYTTLDDLVTAFMTEVLAWAPADTERVGDTNDRREPQALTLVNERLGANVVVLAIPSPEGWGFVQVGDGGLSASVDEDETVTVEFTPTRGSVSSSIETRFSDGSAMSSTAVTPGTVELPESIRLTELVSALVVDFDDQGNVISVTGGTFATDEAQTPSPTPPQGTGPGSFRADDVLGTWVVTRREQPVDDTGSRAFVPMASPLPTYRFDDGTVSGFDGCNFVVSPWSFTDGSFTTTELTNATAAATTIGCDGSDGNPLPTVGPSPERLELIDGSITMVFEDEDGIAAHAQRLSDLPTPQRLAGSSWILAVDGPDITVHFGRNGTVEFREDATACAAGRYMLDAGVLDLDLDAPLHECTDARLDELTESPLEVVSFSDDYLADTILLVPETGGAVRLFPESASTSTEVTARGDANDTEPASSSTEPDVASATNPPVTASPTTPTTAAVAGSDPAVWVLKPGQGLTSASQSFTALVTRLDCNGGVTGEVLEPTVEIGDTEIVVAFTVEAALGGDCPSNDQVPFVVDIGQPIGDRRLIDGACREAGEAASTSFCDGGGVRN